MMEIKPKESLQKVSFVVVVVVITKKISKNNKKNYKTTNKPVSSVLISAQRQKLLQ